MADSHVIYKAEVQVGIKDKGFKAEAKKISDRVKSLGRDLNIKPGTAEPTKEMKALQAETRKAQQELDRLLKKQESLRKAHQNSPEYKALTKDIQKAEQELDGMIAKQSAWAEMGLVGNSQFNALDDQIEQARVRLEGLYEKQRAIAESGATDKEAQEWYEVGDSVERARTRVQGLYAEQEKMKSSGSAYERAKQAATGVSGAAKKAKKEAAGAANAFRKFGGAVKGASSKLLKFITHGNGAAKALTSMKKGLLTGAGLKPLAKLAAIGGGVWLAVRGISEGMKNLVQYSGETNNSVSMLWGSLIQLKNALATAFAPIFNAAAPALNALIQLVTKAATAIAHFTAAFTGKSTVVVAKQQTADYAASLGDAADAAGSANDAAKEYQKTLLGFDQMNVLNDTDKSSGSGGSGGGGGANYGDMFETVEVSSGAKSLVNRIKEAWKNADFTDLGRDLGNKIAEELNKIPWWKLQNIAYKLGKSIATGFNGLNDSEFWGSLGHAVAESLNTVLTGIEGFVFNFDWTKAGRALADGINHLFLDFDWVKLGKTFSRGAKGIFEALKGLFDDIKWEEIGKSVMSAITHVDWVGIIVSGIKAAGSLASGIIKFLKGAFNEAIDALSNWITSGQIWHDLWDLSKATLDLTLNLIGDGVDLIKTVIKGVSKITIELGGAILRKIKSAVEKIAGFFGFGKNKKTAVPKNNPVQYQGHDYQGVDMSWTGTRKVETIFDGRETRSFQQGEKKYKGLKNETATKSLANRIADPTGWQSNKRTYASLVSENVWKNIDNRFTNWSHWNENKSAYSGMKSESIWKNIDSSFSNWSHWKDNKSAYGALATESILKKIDSKYSNWSHWKANRNEYNSLGSKAVTLTINMAKGAVSGQGLASFIKSFRADGGVYRNGRWMPVTAAAGGGSFTTGQMFIAREAGPELVGRIGSGTSVMNNDQIVASVSAGVAKGAYEAFVSAMRDTGGNSTPVVLEGDAAKMFRIVQRQAVQFMNATGKAPFPV